MFVKLEEVVGTGTVVEKPTARFLRLVRSEGPRLASITLVQKEYQFNPPLFGRSIQVLSLATQVFDHLQNEVALVTTGEPVILGDFDSIEACITSFGYNLE